MACTIRRPSAFRAAGGKRRASSAACPLPSGEWLPSKGTYCARKTSCKTQKLRAAASCRDTVYTAQEGGARAEERQYWDVRVYQAKRIARARS
jgi:hypothetical protein